MKGFFKALGRIFLRVGKTVADKFVDEWRDVAIEAVVVAANTSLGPQGRRERALRILKGKVKDAPDHLLNLLIETVYAELKAGGKL